jgi:Concanavalin A-like lectin/glucanases superfamily
MSRKVLRLSLATLSACAVLAVWTAAATAAVYVSRPALSRTPGLGQTFTISGITTPTARAGVKPSVKIQVLALNDSGTYVVQRTLNAKLVKRTGAPGYRYSRTLIIKVVGKHAFRAVRYSGATIVKRSAIKYAEVTYGSGQLAHWRFDETSGTVAADAAGSLDGALEGPPEWTPGKVRGALSFDGGDGVRVTGAGKLRSQTVTYAAWVNPTSISGGYNELMIFMRDDGSYRGAVVFFLDGSGHPTVEFQNGSVVAAALGSPAAIATGAWSFLAVSYDGAVIRLFVNGVQTAHKDYAGGIDYGSGPWQLHVGGDLYGYPGFFTGLIDEPAVLSRALK